MEWLLLGVYHDDHLRNPQAQVLFFSKKWHLKTKSQGKVLVNYKTNSA